MMVLYLSKREIEETLSRKSDTIIIIITLRSDNRLTCYVVKICRHQSRYIHSSKKGQGNRQQPSFLCNFGHACMYENKSRYRELRGFLTRKRSAIKDFFLNYENHDVTSYEYREDLYKQYSKATIKSNLGKIFWNFWFIHIKISRWLQTFFL